MILCIAVGVGLLRVLDRWQKRIYRISTTGTVLLVFKGSCIGNSNEHFEEKKKNEYLSTRKYWNSLSRKLNSSQIYIYIVVREMYSNTCTFHSHFIILTHYEYRIKIKNIKNITYWLSIYWNKTVRRFFGNFSRSPALLRLDEICYRMLEKNCIRTEIKKNPNNNKLFVIYAQNLKKKKNRNFCRELTRYDTVSIRIIVYLLNIIFEFNYHRLNGKSMRLVEHLFDESHWRMLYVLK